MNPSRIFGLGPNDNRSQANAVSADGSVVVGHASLKSLGSGAYRWSSAEGFVFLGSPYNDAEALSVSADGSVVVGRVYNSSSFPEPFRWTQADGMVSLGFMPGGNQGHATGVSADGSVAVGYGNTTGTSTGAFRWTKAGGVTYLGDLEGGSVESVANAVSADGFTVVGYASSVEGKVAFRWTQADCMVSLANHPSKFIQSEALAVSADGTVVVGTSSTSTGARAFIWDAKNGMRDLQEVLTAAGKASGWTITHATGISANGKIVAGYGTRYGQTEAWILDLDAPPPPSPTAALIWTEELPQSSLGFANSVVRLGYDNGTIDQDIVYQTSDSGGFHGVEYANGLILVANQGAGRRSRSHATRYSPIIVSNVVAKDLDATPGFLWQTTGGGNSIIKSTTTATLTGTGIHDRTYGYSSNINANVGFIYGGSLFTNAVQVVDSLAYFSSSTGSSSTIGLHVLHPIDGTTAPVHTTDSPAINDFEVVGDQIYFGNITNSTIQRVKTDGTGLVTLVTGTTDVNGIDVTDTHIYWSEFTTGFIRRANLDGSGTVTLIKARTGLRGVAVLPLSLTTGPAPQAISIGGLSNIPPFYFTGAINTPIALTPASTSGLPVSLEIVSGPATVSGNSITYTDTGTVVVRATQAGDASFAPATFTTSISAAPRLGQTIDFPQPANVTYSGTPVVLIPAATASSGLAVGFILVSGPATYDYNARTLSVNGIGSITIRAYQFGDTTYASTGFVERTFTSYAPGADTLDTFLANAGVPSDKRGPLDDPDGDGLSNLLEYALGLAPNSTSPNSLPATVLNAGNLTLTYRRAAADVTYTVETNPSLTNPAGWTSAGVTQGTPDVNGNTTATIPASGSGQFLRLRITR